MTLNISKLNASDSSFPADLKQALAWDTLAKPDVIKTVNTILSEVKAEGDAAVLKWTKNLISWIYHLLASWKFLKNVYRESLGIIPTE